MVLQPHGVNLSYFKLRLFDQTEFKFLNIKDHQHLVALKQRD